MCHSFNKKVNNESHLNNSSATTTKMVIKKQIYSCITSAGAIVHDAVYKYLADGAFDIASQK